MRDKARRYNRVVNVTIVGAGIVGCASAYELARRGCRVELVDMRPPGGGATHASAGILAPHIEGQIEAVLRLGVASLAMYPEFVERVGGDGGTSIEFRRCGTLQVSQSDREAERLELDSERLARLGVRHELAIAREVRRLVSAIDPNVRSALLIPEHGYVRVSDLLGSLLSAAAGRITIRRSRVFALEPHSSGVRVRTEQGDVYGDAVVLAAGTWSAVLAVPPLPVRPIRGQLVELKCPTQPFSPIVCGESCYMVPWCSGSVLVGATSEDAGFDETIADDATHRLIASARQLAPGLARAAISDVRVGLRPATPDGLPVIGRSLTMPHVVYATGHYRHGILLAPLTARLVADVVMQEPADPLLELVRPSRFGL